MVLKNLIKAEQKKVVKKEVFRFHDIALIWWIFEKFK
jgi:hypothetical protein